MSGSATREKAPETGTPRGADWDDKPLVAFAIKSAVVIVPLLLSLGITWLVASRWGAPASITGAMVRFGTLGLVAVGVAAIGERGARRLLPLAALYRLSLVFPGEEAPIRFAVALQAGNTRRIKARLEEVEAGGFTGSQADAASLIVELAAALGEHDRLTRGHSERVRAFTNLIAEEMQLSAEDSNKLQWAALVHDVGKLRVDQGILTKPGRLTDEEFEIIKTHPEQGMKIAEPLREYLGEWIGAVGEHHERFDGGGYPNGLAGTEISLAGRIVAVADTYDVITAARSYKKARSPEFARQELADNAGTQFDPEVVRAFLGIGIGRLRNAMWPLSWAAQLPFIGTAVTAPVATTVATAAVTLASVTGVTAATDGFDAFVVPEAIAMVQEDARVLVEVEDPTVPTSDPGSQEGADTSTTSTSTIAVTTTAATSTSNSPTTSLPAAPTTTEAPATSAAPSSTRPDFVPPSTIASSTSAPSTAAPPTTAPSTTAPATTVPTTQAPPSTVVTSSTPRPIVSPCNRVRLGTRHLAGADLSECDLSGLTLTDVDLTGADLTNANLSNTTIEGGMFAGANFTGARFEQATLTDVDLSANMVGRADFTEATLLRVHFVNSEIDGANFTDSEVRGIDFTDATGTPTGSLPAVAQRVICPTGVLVGVKQDLGEPRPVLNWCWLRLTPPAQ